jgi:hypothetical protein
MGKKKKKKDDALKMICDSIDILTDSMDTISKKDFVKDNDLISKKRAELIGIGKLGQKIHLRKSFSDVFSYTLFGVMRNPSIFLSDNSEEIYDFIKGKVHFSSYTKGNGLVSLKKLNEILKLIWVANFTFQTKLGGSPSLDEVKKQLKYGLPKNLRINAPNISCFVRETEMKSTNKKSTYTSIIYTPMGNKG